MITKKELLKQIEALTEEVKNLKNIVITEEMKKLRIREKEYEEQTKLLKNIRFRVKSAKIINDDYDNPKSILVVYQLPTINIELNERGEPKERNDFFYSVNALELVGIEDYELVTRELEKAKYIINDKNNKKD